MPEILITGPSAEPVDVLHVKAHRRITDTAQDVLLPGEIAGARKYAEMRTARQLVHARYLYVIDAFPLAGIGTSTPFAQMVNIPPYAIVLPRAPAVRVVSIQWLDMSSTWQTLDPSQYVVNTSLEPAIITPAFGKVWPIVLPQIGSVKVTYDVGYASPISASGANITVRGPVTWSVGDVVRFSNSGGALPTPLATFTDYYVKTAASGVYTVSATQGGAAVTTTDTGSGTSYIGEIPDGIVTWMLIRIGSTFENREEVAILNRGKVEALPFVDGLLDPYRIIRP